MRTKGVRNELKFYSILVFLDVFDEKWYRIGINDFRGENMSDEIVKDEKEDVEQSEKKIRGLAILATAMLAWLLVWALVLKLGSKEMLVRNYNNISALTLKERILWDLIPFRYRGTEEWQFRQKIDTVLNCFVLAPFGVTLCYIFKKENVWRNAALCLGFAVCIEALQLLTLVGNPATEDLITNPLGCFIGYGFYKLIFRRLNPKQTTRFLIVSNIILALAVVFSVVTIAIEFDTIIKVLTRTL